MLLHESSKIIQTLDRENPSHLVVDRGGPGCSGGFMGGRYAKGSIADKLEAEKKLIRLWRRIALSPKVENALMDIWNEAVVADSADPVWLDLQGIDFQSDAKNEKLKDEINKSFSRITTKLNFANSGTRIFKNWYVDGRLYFYFEQKDGKITEIRWLDPLKLTAVKEIKNGKEKYHFEYKLENNDIFGRFGEDTLLIPSENVVFVSSGIRDEHGIWLSYLNKAVRPLNLLSLLENSLVIHRFVRSPERWVFKIDVAGMSKKRAKAYMEKLRNEYRSRFQIDPTSGEVSAENTTLAMQENIYIPKTTSQGGGHDIDTIGGGASFGDIDDVLYFKDEVAMALNLPERAGQDAMFQFGGRQEEISRAEYKWFRFIKWLRGYFNDMFIQFMQLDLVGHKIMSAEEFNDIKNDILFVYENDSVYEESKRVAKLTSKLDMLRDYAEMADEWYGEEWIRRNILGEDNEEIKANMKHREEFKKKNKDSEGY